MGISNAVFFSSLSAVMHLNGDTSTRKNIFLGNKLPKNLISVQGRLRVILEYSYSRVLTHDLVLTF